MHGRKAALSQTFDFVAHCRPVMMLATVDRRPVRITAVDGATGLIYGEVAMFGPCVWRRDGLWTEAPCGAQGPLDLAAPTDPSATPPDQRHASVMAALDGPNRHFCCD
jgi:predicted small lipoprotein YifL